ncbi:MAG: MBL fold metallo-hydrolase [Chloroflexi bacterium]|nr:MBL fold metallo-hydrolase [Chloroflexota bacterium]
MDRLTILGSSNAIAKVDQENSYLLIQTETRKILVDCGDHPVAGLNRVGVGLDQITDLVITHFHADHVGSLPLLVMDMSLEKRTLALTLYGLEYTLERVKKLLDLFDWQMWPNRFPVTFHSIPEAGEDPILSDSEIRVSALPVLHLIPTIGLRFEFADHKVITYSCDSEPCENLNTLARNADVLLQEAAGQAKGHSSAMQAGTIASQAGVKRLILIHFEARHDKKGMIRDCQKTFPGTVEFAFDGMVV